MRDCGSCKACCIWMDVYSMDKPAGKACKYLCSAGCDIYEDRPGDCREFMCAWLMGVVPENLKPNTVNAIIWHSVLSDGEQEHGSYRVTYMRGRNPAGRVMKWARDMSHRHPVIFSDGHKLRAMLNGQWTESWGMKDRMGFKMIRGKIVDVELERGAA